MADNKETQAVEGLDESTENTNSNVDISDAPAEATGEASAEPVQLQIGDLQALARIINIASRRGAFEASEMQAVGTTFNKLNTFLGYVASVQQESQTTEGEEGSKESTEQ